MYPSCRRGQNEQLWKKKRTFGILTQNFRFELPRLQTSWFRELPHSRAKLAVSLPPDMSALSAVGVPAASCVDSRLIAISICHMKGEESGVPLTKKKKWKNKKQMRHEDEEATVFQIQIKAQIYQECFSGRVRTFINQLLPW